MINIDITTYALCKKLISSALTGVSEFTLNGNTMNITTKDGKTSSADLPAPKDGVSVSNAKIDENNNLIFEMSDGSTKIAGVLPVGKVITDKVLSDESENPIANKTVSEEIKKISEDLDNTLKSQKNDQVIYKEDVDGVPMNAIHIDTNVDSGYMSISPKEITIRSGSASDVSPAVVVSSSDGVTLYNKPLTFGAYRAADKMKITDNYIESDELINFSTISTSPSLTSNIRLNPEKGSLALGEIKRSYESTGVASGVGSIAVGTNVTASGNNSIAIGKNAKATANNSLAMGNSNYMGFWTKGSTASGVNSFAWGDGVTASQKNQFAIGSFNKNQTYNCFEIGNGQWSYPSGSYSEAPSNAFSVDKNGNITSGGTTVANSGSIDISSNFSISVNSIYPTMAETIISKFAAIVFNLRNILHRDDKSTYSDIMKDIDTFAFTFKTPYNEYNVHAKRMTVSLRSSSTIDYEYSWTNSLCENKCIVSVAGYTKFTDSTQAVTGSVRVSDYSVGVIQGATETNDGQSGLAPIPKGGQESYILTGSGQWTPNILQIRKNETVGANSSVAMTISDTNFYLLSIIASGVPELDLYIISAYQNGGRLDCTRLTGSGDNDNYTVARTGAEVLTITNKMAVSGLECKLYRVNLPNIW